MGGDLDVLEQAHRKARWTSCSAEGWASASARRGSSRDPLVDSSRSKEGALLGLALELRNGSTRSFHKSSFPIELPRGRRVSPFSAERGRACPRAQTRGCRRRRRMGWGEQQSVDESFAAPFVQCDSWFRGRTFTMRAARVDESLRGAFRAIGRRSMQRATPHPALRATFPSLKLGKENAPRAQSQRLAFLGKPGRWTWTTQKRWPVGASIPPSARACARPWRRASRAARPRLRCRRSRCRCGRGSHARRAESRRSAGPAASRARGRRRGSSGARGRSRAPALPPRSAPPRPRRRPCNRSARRKGESGACRSPRSPSDCRRFCARELHPCPPLRRPRRHSRKPNVSGARYPCIRPNRELHSLLGRIKSLFARVGNFPGSASNHWPFRERFSENGRNERNFPACFPAAGNWAALEGFARSEGSERSRH